VLRLRLNGIDVDFAQRLQGVLAAHRGGTTLVRLSVRNTQARGEVELGPEWRVRASHELRQTLEKRSPACLARSSSTGPDRMTGRAPRPCGEVAARSPAVGVGGEAADRAAVTRTNGARAAILRAFAALLPRRMNPNFLEFEQPIAELEAKIQDCCVTPAMARRSISKRTSAGSRTSSSTRRPKSSAT
jgi:hypothetical protein